MLPSRRLSAMAREALGLIETKGMLGAIEVTRAATQAADVSIASAEHTESGRVIVKIEGDWETVVAAIEAGARAAEQAQQLVSMHIIPRPDEIVSPILPYRLFIDRYYPTGDSHPKDKPNPQKVPSSRDQRQSSHSHPSVSPLTPKPTLKLAPKPINRSKPLVVSTASSVPPSSQQSPDPSPRPITHEPETLAHTPSFAELEALPVVKLRQYARALSNLPIQGRQISMANKQQLLDAIKAII